MAEKQHPLILVFYLDRELMKNQEIMKPFASSVNQIIKVKDMNAVAFFLATDSEERIECINPAIVPEEEMAKISKMVDDISKQFGMGDILDPFEQNDQ